MITWRLITNTFARGRAEDGPFCSAWQGLTIGDIAPAGASSCLFMGRLIHRGSEEWRESVPVDGSALTFIESDSDAGFIGQGLLIGALSPRIAPSAVPFIPSPIIGFANIGLNAAQIGYGLRSTYGSFKSLFPTTPGFGSGASGESAYGFGSLSNAVGNNLPVPVCYGRVRFGGVIASAYTRADSEGNEVLFYKLVLSEGPIQSIGQYTSDQDSLTGANLPDTLELNGIDAKDLENLEVSLRLGSTTQTVMPGFEDVVIRYDHDYRLQEDVPFKWVTRDRVHAADVHFIFPRGLFKVDETTGDNNRLIVDLTIAVYDKTGTTLVSTENIQYKDKKANGAFWFTHRIEFPTYGEYQIRVTRTDVEQHVKNSLAFDEIRVAAINEIRRFAVANRNRAMIGLKVTASSQLSGGIPNTLVTFRGVKLGGTTWSRNPSLIAQDFLKNTRYGMGSRVAAADIDADSFSDWQDNADELIDPWTGSGDFSGLEESPANTGSVAPVLSGSWTQTDNWGTWSVAVTDYVTATSVELTWSYTPDDEANGSAADYVTNHTDTSAQTVQFGLSGSINPGLTYAVGDVWTFRVLKEPRSRLDMAIVSPRSGIDIAQDMAKSARCVLMRVGSQFVASLDNQRVASATFSDNANIVSGTLTESVAGKATTYNVVECQFIDEDNNYETSRVAVESDGIAGGLETERRLSVELPGVYRRTQANRVAAFLLRTQLYQRRSMRFTGGLEALTLLPGQVVRLNSTNMSYAYTGRIASAIASTSVTLDRSVAFESGRVYTLIECESDGTYTETDFDGTGTTTATISVSPAEDEDSAGNPYIVGLRDSLADQWVVTNLEMAGDVSRTVSCVPYTDTIYGDDAPPIATSYVAPVFSGAPANVTDIAVVETVATKKISNLALTWTASAGSPAAARYAVFFRIPGSTYGLAGETTTASFSMQVNYETGTPITFAIQPIAADGSRLALGSVATYTYVIHRNGNNIIVFPDDITGLALTPGTDNAATLSWDADMNADGYEVRCGGWHEAFLIYRGTTNSVDVEIAAVGARYYVRAYNTIGGTRYYSPAAAVVEQVNDSIAAYPTPVTSETPWDFESGGETSGWAIVDWYDGLGINVNNNALQLQNPSISSTLFSPTYDMGSVADTWVSLHMRVVNFLRVPTDDYAPVMEHTSFYGDINGQYFNWELRLQWSNNGSDWDGARIDNDFNQTIIKNKRYFRFKLNIKGIKQDPPAEYPALFMIQYFLPAFRRA